MYIYMCVCIYIYIYIYNMKDYCSLNNKQNSSKTIIHSYNKNVKHAFYNE